MINIFSKGIFNMASTTFAGSTIETTSGYPSFTMVTLPSGKQIVNINGWGPDQYNSYAKTLSDADAQSLYSISASADTIIAGLRKQDEEAAVTTTTPPPAETTEQPTPPVTEPTTVQPEADPFEKTRLEAAAQNEQGGPTAQVEVSEAERADLMNQIDNIPALNRAQLAEEERRAGITSQSIDALRSKGVQSTQTIRNQSEDWRVRLQLAPSATYLYKTAKKGDLLFPLLATDGVIFPYTPTIQTSYRANYDPSDLAHSNYRMYFYRNSALEDVTITAEFTAQDTEEANYLLAVMHFFKSVTKMFYGQDNTPQAGTPPPLCYLSGYGAYQYDNHPLAISNFSYTLPNDVDYIRAGAPAQFAGQNSSQMERKSYTNSRIPGLDFVTSRLFGSNLNKGGVSSQPSFNYLSNKNATYVPTKIQFTITGLPIVTRNDISKNFSLKDYATGKLLRGSQRKGGGIW